MIFLEIEFKSMSLNEYLSWLQLKHRFYFSPSRWKKVRVKSSPQGIQVRVHVPEIFTERVWIKSPAKYSDEVWPKFVRFWGRVICARVRVESQHWSPTALAQSQDFLSLHFEEPWTASSPGWRGARVWSKRKCLWSLTSRCDGDGLGQRGRVRGHWRTKVPVCQAGDVSASVDLSAAVCKQTPRRDHTGSAHFLKQARGDLEDD